MPLSSIAGSKLHRTGCWPGTPSLPCIKEDGRQMASLSPDEARDELANIKYRTGRPTNFMKALRRQVRSSVQARG
jgi:hypothetical protein